MFYFHYHFDPFCRSRGCDKQMLHIMYISWTQKTQDASGSEDENADVSAATLDSVTCLQCTRTRDAPSKFVEVRGSCATRAAHFHTLVSLHRLTTDANVPRRI